MKKTDTNLISNGLSMCLIGTILILVLAIMTAIICLFIAGSVTLTQVFIVLGIMIAMPAIFFIGLLIMSALVSAFDRISKKD